MAEFQEVMQQYNRMFEACKQGASVPVEASYANAVKQPDLFEEVVMSWAAEHPEPVYPTWSEWLGTKYGYDLREILYEPIKADIAEKLGVNPKEG